jgi:hypothetical protein
MSFLPNIKSIFKENLATPSSIKFAAVGEARGGEAFGKTLQDIANHHKVDIKDLEQELKKGIAIEGEHGEDAVKAKKIAMDHLWENPKYYSKLIGCGLEEPKEEIDEGLLGSLGQAAVGAVKGAANAIKGGNTAQGQDPSQMDPAEYKKYQSAVQKVNKTIEKLTQELQKSRKEKADLAKKYNVNPNA